MSNNFEKSFKGFGSISFGISQFSDGSFHDSSEACLGTKHSCFYDVFELVVHDCSQKLE